MLLDEIYDYLVAEGFDGSIIYTGYLPEKPDAAIRLWESPGEQPLRVKGRDEPVFEYPRFQVMVRAGPYEYQAAREQADALYRSLDGFSGEISGVGYALIRALQNPYLLQLDGAWRPNMVFNCSVAKELSPMT